MVVFWNSINLVWFSNCASLRIFISFSYWAIIASNSAIFFFNFSASKALPFKELNSLICCFNIFIWETCDLKLFNSPSWDLTPFNSANFAFKAFNSFNCCFKAPICPTWALKLFNSPNWDLTAFNSATFSLKLFNSLNCALRASISAAFFLNGSNSANWLLKTLTSAASFLKLFNSDNCCFIALFSARSAFTSFAAFSFSINSNFVLYSFTTPDKRFNLSWINWCSLFNEFVSPTNLLILSSPTFSVFTFVVVVVVTVFL